ncbi:CDT1-like protein a, chloroplastic [Zingiber officinale]|uniref:CDT1-like protein a, chloroplastic n=1 Tax=Zingiber officinale TaxID=94328 RepID=UPI001C4C93AB|nr:CDT1-like protein a, chloroplastic [Zingiber officinale]
MEAESQATPSPAAKKKASASRISPAKAVSLEGQIFTPEKLEQLPLRSRNRGVALSVEEVRRAAVGLRRPSDRSDLAQSDANLSSVEQQLGVGWAPCSSPKSKVKEIAKIPQKYELLCEFFNSLASSLRLLKLKGSMPTFLNICTSIQHLTERRFTHTHLAQLKYIIPEAITVKKVLLHDETTCCMKPELQISLQVEAIEKNIKGKSESGYSILRAVFRERLLNFVKEHPEGDDVPEDELPHPFNPTKLTANPLMNINANATFRESSPSVISQHHFIASCLTSRCFQRRFSSKLPIPNSEKTPLACLSDASICNDIPMFVASSFGHASAPQVHRNQLLGLPTTVLLTKCGSDEGNEDMLTADNYLSEEPNCHQQTPAKRLSTPLRLMANTPECPAPKRCWMTPIQDSPILEKSAKRPAKMKLFTTEKDEDRNLSADEDVLNILPKSLLQSVSSFTFFCIYFNA